MIDTNSRVVVNTFEGEFTGTVIGIRYTTLAELNPLQPVNPDKPLPTETSTPVNTQMPITMYTIQLDDNSAYTGANPLETYALVREL